MTLTSARLLEHGCRVMVLLVSLLLQTPPPKPPRRQGGWADYSMKAFKWVPPAGGGAGGPRLLCSLTFHRSFTEMWFMYIAVHPFEMYNSVFLSVFRVAPSSPQSLVEHFYHLPPGNPIPVSSHCPCPPASPALGTHHPPVCFLTRWLASSGHVIQVESPMRWSFMIGFFHVV